MREYNAALVLHFWGFVTWIASLFAAAAHMMARDTGGRARRTLVLADIAATVTMAAGVYMGIKGAFFRQPWLHIKLGLVAALLVGHVWLRIRAKRGGTAPSQVTAVLSVIVLVIAYLAVFKPLR